MTGTSHGVADESLRDDAGVASSRTVVEPFSGKERQIPAVYGSVITTPVHVYFGGRESFNIRFGDHNHAFEMWTDERGLEAIIETCHAALVRARIAGADLTPTPPPLAAVLDDSDVPF